MAKVIGKSPEYVKQITCRNCASIIEYTLSECKQKAVKDYTGTSDIETYLKCPSCNERIYVSNY